MATITEKEFFEKFMKISQELTYSEVRMLYLIITEPYIIELPQQLFANRIQAHRRTINIGLAKLKRLNYINDSTSMKGVETANRVLGTNNDAILKQEEITAKSVVINSVEDYYSANKKNFVIHEDYFSFILGDLRMSPNYRHNKSFVVEIIREEYPELTFHFDLKKSDFKKENIYYIIRLINSEIIRSRDDRFYGFRTTDILQKIHLNFSMDTEEALELIKSIFPKVRITEKRFSFRKPWKPPYT